MKIGWQKFHTGHLRFIFLYTYIQKLAIGDALNLQNIDLQSQNLCGIYGIKYKIRRQSQKKQQFQFHCWTFLNTKDKAPFKSDLSPLLSEEIMTTEDVTTADCCRSSQSIIKLSVSPISRASDKLFSTVCSVLGQSLDCYP